MANVLTRLKNVSSGSRQPSNRHDLEGSIDKAGDARDIARDLLRRLPDYNGSEDEDTARHDMGAHPVHVHVHQHSQPDNEQTDIEIGPLKAKNLPRWATGVIIGVGIVAAAATAIASHLAAK